MAIDLDELERLAKAATPGPWRIDTENNPAHFIMTNEDIPIHRLIAISESPIATCDLSRRWTESCANAAYIVAACNSLPTLIAENRALQERVRELERQREYLAFELSSDDDQADCDNPHLPCEHREGWLCKAGLKGQMQCWISEAEKAAKEAGE